MIASFLLFRALGPENSFAAQRRRFGGHLLVHLCMSRKDGTICV
jgi:hypothetical protein